MKVQQIARKSLAVAALIALLIASAPGLSRSLYASDLPACCNTEYCPMHHHRASEQQTDKSNCDSHGNSAGNDCSMRACDTTASPVVGTAPFVLVTPATTRVPSSAEPTQMQASRFLPSIISIPLTPPPRILPS